MPEPTFGAELRRLRLAANHTLRSLGCVADLSPTFLNDLEHGRRTPMRRVVERLMWALDIEGRPPSHYTPEILRLRELAFVARGEQCPRCGFGGEETP